MKFACNWCNRPIEAPRPHGDAVDQKITCSNCGGKYEQVMVRQIETRGKPKGY